MTIGSIVRNLPIPFYTSDDRLADCLAAASALFARSEPPSIRRPARIVRHTEFLECRVKSAIHRSRRPG